MGLEISLIKIDRQVSDNMKLSYPRYNESESEDQDNVLDILSGKGYYDNGEKIIVDDDFIWCGRGTWMHREITSLGLSHDFITEFSQENLKELLSDSEKYLDNINKYNRNCSKLTVEHVRELLKIAEEEGSEYIDFELEDPLDFFNGEYIDTEDKEGIEELINSLKDSDKHSWWLIYSY